jgi:transcription termination factor Rho
MPALKDRHLAELHAIAADLDIPRYRLLPRDGLVSAIEDRGGAPEREGEPVVEGTVVDDAAAKPVETDAAGPRDEDEPTEEVSGVLDILPQRYGFLRIQGLSAQPGDVYISAAQIRRCELRTGDSVIGPAREPRRGERHRALVHVDQVNGVEPQTAERPEFDALPPVQPERRLPLDSEPADVLLRAVDLLSPLALGQRVLVRAAQRSGRTTLLRGIARAAVAAEGTTTIVLLVDERPEEATAWREAVPDAEFAIATAEMAPGEQLAVAELALERARRHAETDIEAVLIVDSLTRLAQAAGDAAPVKRLFGSGRNLAGEGSLTVVATTIADGEDEGQADHAVATTESCLVTLDPDLAAAGIHPAVAAAECRVSNEEELRPAEELGAVRKLREELSGFESREAAEKLRERIEGSPSNAELLSSL